MKTKTLKRDKPVICRTYGEIVIHWRDNPKKLFIFDPYFKYEKTNPKKPKKEGMETIQYMGP